MTTRYEQLLKDPRWQRRREEILARDEWRCVYCGHNGHRFRLNVHHKRYRGQPWDAMDDDLQTLCRYCHEALGKHPKGGVWWGDGGFVWEQCPVCGSLDLQDKGSYDKCRRCGHRIVPDYLPEPKNYGDPVEPDYDAIWVARMEEKYANRSLKRAYCHPASTEVIPFDLDESVHELQSILQKRQQESREEQSRRKPLIL